MKLCPVPPTNYDTPEWQSFLAPLVDAFTSQQERAARIDAGEDSFAETARWLHGLKPNEPYPADWRRDPTERANESLWRHEDEADLRAMGRCLHCGSAVELQQVGRCVYTTCGHYRAQGELRKMLPYLTKRREVLSDERRAALLALVATPESPT